ncbi:MAG: hypothetical protein FIA94_05445 [Nitrospirae bacterium]|nr:hypothetical protein [Nitrospirota bacterium]
MTAVRAGTMPAHGMGERLAAQKKRRRPRDAIGCLRAPAKGGPSALPHGSNTDNDREKESLQSATREIIVVGQVIVVDAEAETSDDKKTYDRGKETQAEDAAH